MSAVRIVNSGYPLPTYLVVTHVGSDEADWDVRNIEIWVDQAVPFLIYDDLRMEQLSPDIQADIILALNEHAIRQREKEIRLAMINKELKRIGLNS